ncbi:hypothetical protein [Actinomadura nitritigenes]
MSDDAWSDLGHSVRMRCRLRAGPWAEGHGMPSRVSPSAMER